MSQNSWYKVFFQQKTEQRLQKDDISGKKCTKQKCKTYGTFFKNHTMWLNCSPGISGTIPSISGTILGISGTKKERWAAKGCIEGWWQLVEPLPRSLNLKKDYIPGKKGTIWQNLFFPFVLFFAYFGVTRSMYKYRVIKWLQFEGASSWMGLAGAQLQLAGTRPELATSIAWQRSSNYSPRAAMM